MWKLDQQKNCADLENNFDSLHIQQILIWEK